MSALIAIGLWTFGFLMIGYHIGGIIEMRRSIRRSNQWQEIVNDYKTLVEKMDERIKALESQGDEWKQE